HAHSPEFSARYLTICGGFWCFFLFCLGPRGAPGSTLFPYTTLFRSRRGSGGVGKWRGGDGVVREFEALAPMDASASNSRTTPSRSEEHTSELQSLAYLVCRLLLEKKKHQSNRHMTLYLSLLARSDVV